VRRLGVDYGSKRWGISYADELGIATPIEAIIDVSEASRWLALEKVIRERKIEQVVVGMPYNMDGSVGFKAKEVESFIAILKSKLENLEISTVDERLTSVSASEGWSSKKQRQERGNGKLDSRAASLILQDYLDQLNPVDGDLIDEFHEDDEIDFE
jgi:putative Holliday junction resolvase